MPDRTIQGLPQISVFAGRDERAVQTVDLAFEQAKTHWQDFHKKAARYHTLYKGKKGEMGGDNRRFDIFIDLPSEIIEVVHTWLVDNILGFKEHIKVEPATEEATFEGADQMEELLYLQLNDQKMHQFAYEGFKQALISGTACVQEGWLEEEVSRKIKRQRKIMGFPAGWETVEVVDTIHDEPDFELFSVTDCFPSPTRTHGDDLYRLPHIIRRVYRSYLDVKTLYETGTFNVGSFAELEHENFISGYDQWTEQRKREQDLNHAYISTYGLIECLDYWGKFEVSEGKFEEYHIIKPRGMKKAFLIEPNDRLDLFGRPRKPFFFGKYIGEPDQFFGKSILASECLFHLYNMLFNLVMDNLANIVNESIFIDHTKFPKFDYKGLPGSIQKGRGSMNDAVTFLKQPEIVRSAFVVLELILGHLRDITGEREYIKGGVGGGERTATEAGILASAQQSRIRVNGQYLEDTFVVPLCERLQMLNNQFLLGSKRFGRLNVDPSLFRQPFKYICLGAKKATDRVMRVQELQNAMMLGKGLPGVNVLEIYKEILSELGFRELVDKFVPATPEDQAMATGVLDESGSPPGAGTMGAAFSQSGANVAPGRTPEGI